MSPHAAPSWPCLAAARAHDAAARLPLYIVEDGVEHAVGSVARHHRQALARWPSVFVHHDDRVCLHTAPDERDQAWAAINLQLREEGLVPGWRDEIYPVFDASGRVLARIERAAARFWGTLTVGAHCNGYVVEKPHAGRRPTHLWIARRALTKPTDPGKLDNLIGGGVPFGQSTLDTVRREGWEEAGLTQAALQGLQPGRAIRLCRDIPEGLQHERLQVYDLELPRGLTPLNQDGEVAEFRLLPVDEALALAATDAMTVDAALVTLDFALRRGLLPAAEHAGLAACATALWDTGAPADFRT
jgi:8-oxo-dGTP pyrophosphatase MutT (NUDIX family)